LLLGHIAEFAQFSVEEGAQPVAQGQEILLILSKI
jgi:hypothetical protein